MYSPGDTIPIKVQMDDFQYESELVISFIQNDKIITCGHCLPQNAKLDFGEIIFTTGFDTPNEDMELGIIKINSTHLHKFKNTLSYNLKQLLPVNTSVYNIKNGIKTFGKIIAVIENKSQLLEGKCQINDWIIDHQITKLKPPFYLICGTVFEDLPKEIQSFEKKFNIQSNTKLVAKLTLPGDSGSPWIFDNNFIGIHIGKTIGYLQNETQYALSYIAYVNILI